MGNTGEERGKNKASQETLESMIHFSEQYARRSETFFCSDPVITKAVIEGLAKHREELGSPLCPCRFYEDKEAEVKSAYWNCPCVPMRERKECHCLLFLRPDDPYVGTSQSYIPTEVDYNS